jgi:predicted glycosyltransferase
MKLLIWVQHLFGLGHARRMARIAAACGGAGMSVTIAAGGPGGADAFTKSPNVTAHQLPALKTRDHQYTGLLTAHDESPSDVYWASRQDALLKICAETRPDIVLIELFPFGRRKFAGEVLALIEAAKSRNPHTLIISSVRDIIEPKADKEKSDEMAGWLKAHFDAVLVHGVESIIPLTATAPFAGSAGVPLHYTGYVAPERPSPQTKAGVVVSAGSGASGAALLAVAAQTAKVCATPQRPWHMFVPNDVEPPQINAAGVHVHSFADDFTAHLARAEVSIGEAGYNTTFEALSFGARPVLVPYDEAGQTEQPTRAAALAKAGHAVHLPAQDLNEQNLVNAVETAMTLNPAAVLNLSGAKRSAATLKDLRQQADAS